MAAFMVVVPVLLIAALLVPRHVPRRASFFAIGGMLIFSVLILVLIHILNPFRFAVGYHLLGAPIVEETAKLIVLLIVIGTAMRNEEPLRPRLIIGACAGLAFGAYENTFVWLMALDEQTSLEAGFIIGRAVGTASMHALAGMILGWGVGGGIVRIFVSLIGAIVLHALWNVFALGFLFTGTGPVIASMLMGLPVLALVVREWIEEIKTLI